MFAKLPISFDYHISKINDKTLSIKIEIGSEGVIHYANFEIHYENFAKFEVVGGIKFVVNNMIHTILKTTTINPENLDKTLISKFVKDLEKTTKPE